MNEKERERADHFRDNHGKDIRKCSNSLPENDIVTVSVYACGPGGLGVQYIVVCDRCRASLDVTDYDSW